MTDKAVVGVIRIALYAGGGFLVVKVGGWMLLVGIFLLLVAEATAWTDK